MVEVVVLFCHLLARYWSEKNLVVKMNNPETQSREFL
jgi:hypothetical protein